MRPRTCEFSDKTKLDALRRCNFTCERCHKPKREVGYLEVHHVLGIAIALNYYPQISHAVISSLENAKCYCQKCHDVMDREDRKRHQEIAKELLKYQWYVQGTLGFAFT